MKNRKNITFTEYAKKILTLKRSEGISDNGFYNHWEYPVRLHFSPYFGQMKLEEIAYYDICSFFASEKELSKQTLSNYLTTLNCIFEHAVYDGIIERNPCKFYKLSVGKDSKEKQAYTEEQALMILRYCYLHRFGSDIFLLLKTGVSRAELLGITWSDIDLKSKTISINKDVIDNYDFESGASYKRKVPTKNKFRTRTIAIDDETADFLKTHCKRFTPEYKEIKFLVHNKDGEMISPRTWSRRHYNVFMQDMQDFYAQLGIYVPIYTPHCMRHTRASLYMNKGISPTAIIAQMGWSDTTMLNHVYGHRDMTELRKLLGM